MRLGSEWRHAWKQWAGNFGDFWKKGVSWVLTLGEASWDSNLGEGSPAGGTGCATHLLGQMEQSA